MCDAANETYQLMKKDVPSLVYGLKKGDSTQGLNSLLFRVS